MAYKKVWKNGSVDWGAALSNSAKKSAVARRKRDRERERDRKKAERERESARKKREREALKRRNASIRESARATKANERIAAAKARVTQRAKISSAKQEQKLLDQERKERERVEKKLNTLKGRFLEYDIPLKLFNIDLRVEANNYNEENGLTTVSQFKKVTIPYLEENLFKLAIKIHIDNTFDLLYESELKKVAKSPEIFNHSQILEFKSICKAFLKDTLPKNLNFDDFASFADPINAEAISEFIEANVLPIIPEIKKEIDAEKAAIKKQEEEHKQKAKAKKELDDACKTLELNYEETISESVKFGKKMKHQISKMKSDLVALEDSHNSAWFKSNKKKFAQEAQSLGSVIWNRTPPLIKHIILIERMIRILKNREENSYIEMDKNPMVNQVLEANGFYEKTLTRLGKLYLAFYKNLEMRLINLEKALSYYEDDRELKAIEKVINEGLKLSKDSKNISKLFSKFGGQDGS